MHIYAYIYNIYIYIYIYPACLPVQNRNEISTNEMSHYLICLMVSMAFLKIKTKLHIVIHHYNIYSKNTCSVFVIGTRQVLMLFE